MNTFNGIQELSNSELETINGGVAGYCIAAFIAGVIAGATEE